MKLLPIIIAIILFIIVFSNKKINNSKVGFVFLIVATLILLIDAIVTKERIYISMIFAIIGIVKIIERLNVKRNKNQ
jgi:membrane-bound ClpP family serine protease